MPGLVLGPQGSQFLIVELAVVIEVEAHEADDGARSRAIQARAESIAARALAIAGAFAFAKFATGTIGAALFAGGGTLLIGNLSIPIPIEPLEHPGAAFAVARSLATRAGIVLGECQA